jgi:hypothetical protein
MSWLDRINEHENRRFAHMFQRNAYQRRELAKEALGHLAHEATGIVRTAAHDLADYGRHEGAELARDTASHYAKRAGELAGRYANRAGGLANRAIDYGRAEGAVVAREATLQALRAGRAIKADPMPVIVGAVGLALLANLILGRRPRQQSSTRS